MRRAERRRSPFAWWHEGALLALLVALLGIASVCVPSFLRLENQLLLSRHLWEMAILAIGMTMIVITGGIDLSVGSMMGLCAVTLGMTYAATSSIAAGCLACLAVGIACGALNGLLITRVRVHPLIVTLATMAAFRGVAEGISQGRAYSRFGEPFAVLARGGPGGVPWPGVFFLVMAGIGALILGRTAVGRFLYAIGNNERAARFAGIAVDRVKFGLYTFSGLLAAMATIVYSARFDTAKADAGKGMELDVITAVVVGGTSIFGGRGNLGGTVLGLLLIHETRLFIGRYWKIDELRSIVVGILLIASVLIYRMLARTEDRA